MLAELLTPEQIKILYRGNFTVKQAGLYLGIGENIIRQMIADKKIKINLLGGKRHIAKSECDRVLAVNSGYKI